MDSYTISAFHLINFLESFGIQYHNGEAMLYAGIDYTINGNRKLCDAIIKIKFSTVKKPVQIQIYNEILHVNKYPVQLNSISDKFSFYDPGHLLIEGYETTGIKYSIKLVPQHIFLG